MALREIIFRGKRLDTGEWVEGACFPASDPYPATIFHGKHNALGEYVEAETVGQFTGLTDRNGKRIFEGDILKDDWGKIFVVFFDTEGCSFIPRLAVAPKGWELGNYRFGEAWRNTTRVIGNIHDPELLEVTPDE